MGLEDISPVRIASDEYSIASCASLCIRSSSFNANPQDEETLCSCKAIEERVLLQRNVDRIAAYRRNARDDEQRLSATPNACTFIVPCSLGATMSLDR